MAEIMFRAFLSCSLAEEDNELTEFFRKIIRSFGIQAEIYDYQEVGSIPDKVKQKVIKSDCLIALATRRKKIQGSDDWMCSDWIQHELALANAYSKPIAIFVEEGVKMEGLIGMEERRQKFVRDDLIRDIDKVATFLFNLRKHLESTYQSERLQVPVLLRHDIHAKEEMLSKDRTVVRCEILMESLIDELDSTHHSMELEDTTPGLSTKPERFDFISKESPSGVNVEPSIVLSTEHKFLWKVVFEPPLRRGQKARYAFKVVRPNYRPWTYDQMVERINNGTYEYKEPICEACELYIAYPTAEFAFDFEFPEAYEISGCHPDVRIGEKLRLKAAEELRRVNAGGFFSAEKIFDKWILALRVPKPVQGHLYYTYYQPPRSAEAR